ncbi:MAG: radical SAM protein [Clostridia bacterium]
MIADYLILSYHRHMNDFLLKKVYVEIGNICNLHCNFCANDLREKSTMSIENFEIVAEKVKKVSEHIYLHVLGEPLLHPQFEKILQICKNKNLKVNLVTNGTLIEKNSAIILNSDCVRKVAFSLHSFEANLCGNKGLGLEKYVEIVSEFVKLASNKGIVCELRFWNNSSKCNSLNDEITKKLEKVLTLPNVFVGKGDKFDWRTKGETRCKKCMGCRDQLGVLVDGTVVPCCIDFGGEIRLGNIFNDSFETILSSNKAQAIAEGFKKNVAVENFCMSCGFHA